MSNPLEQRRLKEWRQVRRRTIQSLPAQLRVQVRVVDLNTGRVGIEQATASGMNLRRDIVDMRMRAEVNAKYQYLSRTQSKPLKLTKKDYNFAIQRLQTEVLNEEFVYLIAPSRQYKRENIGGKYFNVVRDEDGKQITKTPWRNK